uniref:Uncharacterized protein n=1 Tax=Anguilla anguilla TaxID=7936 RepID=A0A0E9WSD7_ANGAN
MVITESFNCPMCLWAFFPQSEVRPRLLLLHGDLLKMLLQRRIYSLRVRKYIADSYMINYTTNC